MKFPGSLYEGGAYAEHCVSRLIISFKRLPEFAALDINDQMHILKVFQTCTVDYCISYSYEYRFIAEIVLKVRT